MQAFQYTRNECTFYNCVRELLDKQAAIQTQEHRIEQGLPVRNEDRPVPLTKRPFLTRDSLSKQYKRVCVHSNIPINVPGLQLIDSTQVLPDGLEAVNASGKVAGTTIREFVRGMGIANTQQQHAQRTLITAME
ncbi:hypothetical protein BC939DRAFT_499562 [Gamsiella multidivaricata]|uniref:uncharacterized protein n=1 Tax=Gamsiella multidivaricata TaxID=101098 RepID=UPI00221FB2E6|nr:uncharacterized protein BC939DRAFT_499562 [Gamsiella multidivaricata]KAI7830430.1 hypothetical protein BC939DRAFT_499562 [Gamsiella multidivaricata]